MKRIFGTVLLGSALLLSNNSSAEASYSTTEVHVQKIEIGSFVDKGFSLNNTISNKDIFELYKTFFNEQVTPEEVVQETPSKQVVQPTPEENATPSKPEAQQAPEENVTTSEPEAQPAPEEAVTPVKPEVTEAPTKPAEETGNTSVSAIEQAVLNLTNVERQKAGLGSLQADSKLMASARAKSVDMSSNGYFSHTSPTYGSPFDQMKQFGISYKLAGENIAMGQRTAEEVVKAWMDSPGHKENILKPGFTHIGIGYDASGHYWTQQFIQK